MLPGKALQSHAVARHNRACLDKKANRDEQIGLYNTPVRASNGFGPTSMPLAARSSLWLRSCAKMPVSVPCWRRWPAWPARSPYGRN